MLKLIFLFAAIALTTAKFDLCFDVNTSDLKNLHQQDCLVEDVKKIDDSGEKKTITDGEKKTDDSGEKKTDDSGEKKTITDNEEKKTDDSGE